MTAQMISTTASVTSPPRRTALTPTTSVIAVAANPRPHGRGAEPTADAKFLSPYSTEAIEKVTRLRPYTSYRPRSDDVSG